MKTILAGELVSAGQSKTNRDMIYLTVLEDASLEPPKYFLEEGKMAENIPAPVPLLLPKALMVKSGFRPQYGSRVKFEIEALMFVKREKQYGRIKEGGYTVANFRAVVREILAEGEALPDGGRGQKAAAAK